MSQQTPYRVLDLEIAREDFVHVTVQQARYAMSNLLEPKGDWRMPNFREIRLLIHLAQLQVGGFAHHDSYWSNAHCLYGMMSEDNRYTWSPSDAPSQWLTSWTSGYLHRRARAVRTVRESPATTSQDI